MRLPPRLALGAVALPVLAGLAACQSFPPAVTAITIFPSDAQGMPLGDQMRWTRRQPPIPLIGVRPGADPQQSAMFLNEPSSGQVAVTLARGVQSFLLYTAEFEPSPHFVIAVFLDRDATPALSSVVDSDPSRPPLASRADVVMGLEGEPVPNHSSLSVTRDGYQVSLRRAAFPLGDVRVDTVNPWWLQPDNVVDAVGVITIEVQPTGKRG